MENQSPEVLVNQLRTNLKGADELTELLEVSKEVKASILERGYGGFVGELNEVRRLIGNGELFEESDFEGAEVYSDERFSQVYTEKHTLPPIGFGVLLPESKWDNLARKLNCPSKFGGKSVDGCFFRGYSSSGLEIVGVNFHINRGLDSDIEFEFLFSNPLYYSDSFREAMKMNPEKLRSPQYLMLAFEHTLIKDIAAWRADSDFIEDKVVEKLKSRPREFVGSFLEGLHLSPGEFAIGMGAFVPVLGGAVERTPAAVYAAAELDKTIGIGLTTPILFSLGSTQEELGRHHLLSPLIGIASWNKYINSGKINTVEVKKVIEQKGYVVQDSD